MADDQVTVTTEYGVRFSDGTVWPRASRDAAMLSARSINGRHGAAQVVTRQVTFGAWTEAKESD
jgi:hypothetical protein